ncbi:unnamed protein product [Blumeria hordei]|uniref:Ras-GAP domain-containing protein n=1 Tax=Blumeria hordei TaxID=2867405 RepID=A0A383UZU1_BLUHO|nr:unnamed protein product [Blumeria hordei]
MERPSDRPYGQVFPVCPPDSIIQGRRGTWAAHNTLLDHQNSSESLSPRREKQVDEIPKSTRSVLTRKTSQSAYPAPVIASEASTSYLPSTENTAETVKISMLMKHLCGRMRGEAECQGYDGLKSRRGLFYIDYINGSLMYENDQKRSLITTVIPDLKGLQIKTGEVTESQIKYLVLSNRSLGIYINFIPKLAADYDLWLAALLCWQQIGSDFISKTTPNSDTAEGKVFHDTDPTGSYIPKNPGIGNIIKVAKLLLWDRERRSSQVSTTRKTSVRALRSPSPSPWRPVSCILQDTGEFKLLSENDNTILSVIQLSQLSRCSIQILDRSVLDEEFCIAIFPHYVSSSPSTSHPIYISSESRLTHEVWFCLFRAFTIPEIYGPWKSTSTSRPENSQVIPSRTLSKDMFRIEKSLKVRILEAKINNSIARSKSISTGKQAKEEIETSTGDYFAELILDGEIRARTCTQSETDNPFWREEYKFQNLPPRPPSLRLVLKRVSQKPALSRSSTPNAMGIYSSAIIVGWTSEISVESLDRNKDNENWWPVLDKQLEIVGELLLGIKYEEVIVLLANDYKPISELLHNFSNGLTIQISQLVHGNLKLISEMMMNIFQVSGYAGEWLMTLVEDEVDGPEKELPKDCRIGRRKRVNSNESLFFAMSDREQNVRDMGKSLQEEANLLFRGNSLLTQALDLHMRRVGKEYLEDVLSEKILKINSMNPDCEVDPSRISNSNDSDKNWTLIFSLTTEVWDSIASSATRCPPELRQILKYIRAVAEDRYGNFLRTVTYTSVSGFLFLRFFCPALLNPKSFGLLRDHPQPKAQRTLTLIAKSLQALANLSKFGKKEAWMERMNQFLATHRQGMKDFIDMICAIPVEHDNSILPASYSTPITIYGRLPPTSREGFPSLPYLIDHAQNFSRLVQIWLEATKKGMTIDNAQEEVHEFHQLCLQLQQRTDECLFKAEQLTDSPQRISPRPSSDLIQSPSNDIIMETPRSKRSSDTSLLRDLRNYPLATPEKPLNTPIGREVKLDRQVRSSVLVEQQLATILSDGMDLSPTNSTNQGFTRDGRSQRAFLGGLRRKGKDHEVLNRGSGENFMDPSWAGGFV